MSELAAVVLVRRCDPQGWERVEHVELGHDDFGEAGQTRGMSRRYGIEPATTTRPARGGAELLASVTQAVAIGVEKLGGKRSVAHACGVGLDHADHLVELAGPNAATCKRPCRRTIARGHERVTAVIQIEKRALRALEEHVAPVVEQLVHATRRVAQERPQQVSRRCDALDHGVDVELARRIEDAKRRLLALARSPQGVAQRFFRP